MNHNESEERGTVKAVRLPNPERGEGVPVMAGRVPALDSPVVVELHGHPHRYVVHATRTPDDGPVLVELRILGDGAAPIDQGALRAVNVRRLAHAAIQFLTSAGGQFVAPGDTPESYAKPERAAAIRRRRKADDALLADVAGHVQDALDAIAAGDTTIQILEFVADRIGKSTATAGRLIRQAKAEGFLPDKQLPRRK
ncbi:hypothetical protein [Nocardia asteroides]